MFVDDKTIKALKTDRHIKSSLNPQQGCYIPPQHQEVPQKNTQQWERLAKQLQQNTNESNLKVKLSPQYGEQTSIR